MGHSDFASGVAFGPCTVLCLARTMQLRLNAENEVKIAFAGMPLIIALLAATSIDVQVQCAC